MSNVNNTRHNPVNTQSYLVWMDMEMSGLDPDNARILEIATLITDNDLKLIAEGPYLVVHQDDSVLEAMDEWNQTHHRASGLIKRVRASRVTDKEAEEATLQFLRQHTPEKKSPLCGNTIGQDRRFLRKYMPRLEGYLHYRNVDVSSFKEMIARWAPEKFNPPFKKGKHMALLDIQESIEELAYYRDQFISLSTSD